MNCHCCADGKYKKHNQSDCFICTTCDHIFRRYDGDVVEYHTKKYREKHPVYSHAERMKYVANILSAISPFLSVDMKCIEVGSAEGTFAIEINPLVQLIECCEVDPVLAQKTAEMGFVTYARDYLTLNKKYDTAFAFDVVEHILDVRQMAEHVNNTIEKKFIFQVPVKRRIIPPNPVFDGHSHYFSEQSIRALFSPWFSPEFIKVSGYGEFARGPEMLIVMKRNK